MTRQNIFSNLLSNIKIMFDNKLENMTRQILLCSGISYIPHS